MRRSIIAIYIVLVPVLSGRALAEQPETVRLGEHTFTLPSGFTIERVAASPLVDRPITAAFDEQGRLYVADSSGSNDKVEKQLAEKPHRVVRLEDRDNDGTFDQSTVFADRLMLPEGTMWHDGSLYVAAPPSIWKLTDTNDDGVADERVEWFNGKTLTGCANDLHGPYLGRDGWIYWCKGAFAEQTYPRPGKPPLVTRASHIFRARPDGSDVESVMTGGMDNPVDVVFTPGGERILSCTFLQHPAGGNRDGLIHALYGGVYGKVHDVIESHPRTGPDVLPPLTHLGPAAPCGLAWYESAGFGSAYENSLFTALFNLQKVTHHRLIAEGASLRTEDVDFLVSDNRDFHPTDVLEDADGSLLVVDTGGWYKLCCPTSQLVKPDVLGAIYRVRRKDMPRSEDPRGMQIDWKGARAETLTELLADPRHAVRERAMAQLASFGISAIGPLRSLIALHDSPRVRRNAVWTLARIDHADARQAVRAALSDVDDTVQQAALHTVSLWRNREAKSQVEKLLNSESPATRRAAAEAIGRIGDSGSVAALLRAIEDLDASKHADWALEHSLTFALIEIAADSETQKALTSKSPAARKAAMVALDQVQSDLLTPQVVADELLATNNPLRSPAQWILRRHTDWGDVLTPMFARQLASDQLTQQERSSLEQQLAELASAPRIITLLGERAASSEASVEERLSALRAMELARLPQVPLIWLEAVHRLLKSDNPKLVQKASQLVTQLALSQEQLATLEASLKILADDETQPLQVRLSYFAKIPKATIDDRTFMVLFEAILQSPDAHERSLLLQAFRSAKLNRSQVEQLLGSIERADTTLTPADSEGVLQIAAGYADASLGAQLLVSLGRSPHCRGMASETIGRTLKPFGDTVVKRAEELLKQARLDNNEQAKELDKHLDSLPQGDIRRGQAVFNGSKANCASCHSIGYLCGKLGPDLTKIGAIRNQRDLMEAILFPSASFVRSYEPYMVLTTKGESVSGLLRKNAADEVVLAKDAKTEIRIPRADIEELQSGRVSIMPDGIVRQLTDQELADLLAFLQACR